MSLAFAAPSVRMRLRAATEEVHEALHRAAPFAAIADGRATRESYAGTLAFLYRYHAGMAGWCAAGAGSLGLEATHPARLAALRQDLAFFGQAVRDVTEEPARGGAFAAGVLYTVQGSTLGGKVICRQLDALLEGEDGRRFFAGSRDDGRHWQILCAALEHQGDDAALEAGARHAFARFAAMLAG